MTFHLQFLFFFKATVLECQKTLRAIHEVNVENLQSYNVVAICKDATSLQILEKAMLEKLTVVQKAFWYDTAVKKPDGKYTVDVSGDIFVVLRKPIICNG